MYLIRRAGNNNVLTFVALLNEDILIKKILHMKNFMFDNWKAGSLILSAIFISMSLSAQVAANFTGSWTFNESKSKMAEDGQRMLAKKLNIIQGENSITLERIFISESGDERKMIDTYTLDGKESVNPLFNTTKKSIAVWSEDKMHLRVSSVIVLNMNGQTNEIKILEEYHLDDDGNNLVIDTKSSSVRGERKATIVYDRNN